MPKGYVFSADVILKQCFRETYAVLVTHPGAVGQGMRSVALPSERRGPICQWG